MNPVLRALMKSTVAVRRVSAYTAGGTETLDAAVSLPAYVELRREWAPGSSGAERRTSHLVVLDPEDVSASTLATIRADDRFWLDGAPTADATFSKLPQSVAQFTDPLTGALSHYEVSL